jgi:hypothetical protein
METYSIYIPFYRHKKSRFNDIYLIKTSRYMEVRMKINDKFVDELKQQTGITSTTQLTTEAFTFLKWAVSEARKGRVIVSANEDGSEEREIVMPSLQSAKARATAI